MKGAGSTRPVAQAREEDAMARKGRLPGIALWLAATYGHIHANGMPAGIWRWF